MKLLKLLIFSTLIQTTTHVSAQQVIPPGRLTIDGIPVSCGPYPTIIASTLPDVGSFDGQAIYLNPNILAQLPTPLKLYWYAHECAHGIGFLDEAEADCWAIRTGRDQGWFPPTDFNSLMQMFSRNPGSIRHPPGPVRVQIMMNCYGS